LFIVRNSPFALIGIFASIAITLFMYFAVIRPTQHTANNAVNNAVQQERQALKQSSSQLSGRAKQLTDCLATAGVNVSAVQACQAKFGTP
jgi:hypothetical protein